MRNSDDTDNLVIRLNNPHCKIPDNHSSDYEIYFRYDLYRRLLLVYEFQPY